MPKGPQGQKRKADVIGNAVPAMKSAAGLTAAHLTKLENHVHMVALNACWYNFAPINSAVRTSPAMTCGLERRLWDIADIVKLVEEWEVAE